MHSLRYIHGFSPAPIESPLSFGWPVHGLCFHQFFFYYERSTGRTTWDPPDPPDQFSDSPRALQRRECDDTAVEGVVLQQTRSSEAHPRYKSGTAQHPRALVHQHAAAGHPKRRKRVASKGNKRVYTDATLLHKDSSIEDDEPRKVGGLKTSVKV